jgi:hypothetical protein
MERCLGKQSGAVSVPVPARGPSSPVQQTLAGWLVVRATSLTNRSSHRDADKKAPLTLALSAPPPFSLAVQQLVVHDLVLGGPRRFHDSSIGSVGPGKGNT